MYRDANEDWAEFRIDQYKDWEYVWLWAQEKSWNHCASNWQEKKKKGNKFEINYGKWILDMYLIIFNFDIFMRYVFLISRNEIFSVC